MSDKDLTEIPPSGVLSAITQAVCSPPYSPCTKLVMISHTFSRKLYQLPAGLDFSLKWISTAIRFRGRRKTTGVFGSSWSNYFDLHILKYDNLRKFLWRNTAPFLAKKFLCSWQSSACVQQEIGFVLRIDNALCDIAIFRDQRMRVWTYNYWMARVHLHLHTHAKGEDTLAASSFASAKFFIYFNNILNLTFY